MRSTASVPSIAVPTTTCTGRSCIPSSPRESGPCCGGSRRRPPGASRKGGSSFDRTTRSVSVGGCTVHLAGKEFELLSRLASDPRRVFTKEELLRDVWGYRALCRTRTLESHASRLRRKLAVGAGDRFVVNVWGVGYKLVE